MYQVGIITASDQGAKGTRVDLSGPLIEKMMEQAGYQIVTTQIVPDEQSQLEKAMVHMADVLKVQLILTTGGTGFSLRDVTPEATESVIDRHVPGIAEAMRHNSLAITKKAMLSRGIAGIRGSTLIVNLPGSPKAVAENLSFILDPLAHGLMILAGDASECARS